ncbi:formimidoylglutamate deiminase [Pedomonas sp. V897]|uniref:formimidoylglutamate deiminase n=1 Tax=Pedomonas sp. V897 TaxID=3446482 RepID=UPI003EDE982A
MATIRLERVLTPEGWRDDVALTIDSVGMITAIRQADNTSPCDVVVRGAAIPGLCNAHSHAFQRAMAGQAEWRGAGEDSFWTWRERMYDLALRITPEDLHAIASRLYVEMLKAGYTQVCEFHYVHHAETGAPYAVPTTLSEAIFAAAAETGIGLTHLPTLYQTGDFGGVPAGERQRRFLNTTDGFLRLVEQLDALAQRLAHTRVGVAFHSLRAVPPEALRETLAVLATRPGRPLHIHIAEQQREVEACRAATGQRPVEWLLANAPVGEGWSLVHATHMSDSETAALAKTGAVAVLCPTTEANLGDGLFPLAPYLAAGGRIAIGSDSHISVSASEELRWLDYGQRLILQKRNVSATPQEPHTGARLWRLAAEGGAQAAGVAMGRIAVGCRADLLVLDLDAPTLTCLTGDTLVDALVFAGQPNPIRHVMVAGQWRVRDGWHPNDAASAVRYRQTLRRLLSA